MLLAFALAGSARLAMAMNDPPYYLFLYVPDATDKPPLYYTKVCPLGKTEDKDTESRSCLGHERNNSAGRMLKSDARRYGIISVQ